MAKKQSRKTKKSVNDVSSAPTKKKAGSKSTGSIDAALKETGSADSARASEYGPNSQVDWQIYASLIFAAGFIAYFFLFSMAKTADGTRLGLYLYFFDNLSIYNTFWTGSATGSIEVLDRWPILLGVSFHLLIAYGIGNLCLRWLRVRSDFDQLEVISLSLGIGLSLISVSTFLIGCLQLYSFKQFCVVPALITGLAGLIWRSPNGSDLDSDGRSEIENESHLTDVHPGWFWIGIAAIPFALFILMGSMIPPWEYDVREYHLQVPKEWYQDGGVSFMPHNVYGNMPLGTEMHALFAMLYSFGENDWWWGAMIGKTVSGCFAILNAMVLFSIGKRLSGRFAGVGAALLYLTTPWTVQNSIIGYNESAMACYLLLAVFLMILFFCKIQNRKEDINTQNAKTGKTYFGLLFLLGMMIGSSVAAKYTAVVFVALPAIILFIILQFVLSKERIAVVGKRLSFICIGMLVTCGPWLLKNAVLTGNPTYPLAVSVFSSSRTEKQNAQWQKAHSVSRKEMTESQFQNTINSLLFANSWLSPLLFPCLILGCLQTFRIRINFFLIGFLIFSFVVWWLATHRLERFLLPFYPVVCLVAGFGIGWSKHKAWLATISLILFIGASCNFLIATSRIVGDVRVFAPLTQLDVGSSQATDYKDERVAPLAYLSPATALLNENRPAARVLFLGECRPFYAKFDVVYNTCFDPCETWKRFAGRTPPEVKAELNADGIDFLLVNWSELNRLQSTYGYNVDVDVSEFDYAEIRQFDGSIFKKVTDLKLPSSIELFEVIE